MLIFTGKWLKRKREELGFSKKLLAKCVGTSEKIINDTEEGELIIDVDLVRKIHIFFSEHMELEELSVDYAEVINKLREFIFIYGEDKEIYVAYKYVPYEYLEDFYDFVGFVVEEQQFKLIKKGGYYGTSRLKNQNWIKIDIKTALDIFELQRGGEYEENAEEDYI